MKSDFSIVRADRFIEATRDSGYKGTDSALSELIDNSIQAGAKSVTIEFVTAEETSVGSGRKKKDRVAEVLIADNGRGMDAETLRRALRFGDSSRFNDRTGIGRFGMGLPNASVNQCQRVEVYSWTRKGKPLFTFIDVDLIAKEKLDAVPEPEEVTIPREYSHLCTSPSGTLVVWKRCDRLDNNQIADTLAKKLRHSLGRMFRYYLAADLQLTVNRVPVRPFDPLFLMPQARIDDDMLATQYGETMRFDVPLSGKPDQMSTVEVVISVLPEKWQTDFGPGRTAEQKEWLHSRHIDKTAGFSIVRSHREIDIIQSPFHMSHWRDRWFRVEVRFEPDLDEEFGVTHTKQHASIWDGSPVFSRMKQAIWANLIHVRHLVDTRKPPKQPTDLPSKAEDATRRVEARLKPIEAIVEKPEAAVHEEREAFIRERVSLGATSPESVPLLEQRLTKYPVLVEKEHLIGAPFYRTRQVGSAIIVMLNTTHPFFERVYSRLEEGTDVKTGIDLLLMSLARGEETCSEEAREWYELQRQEWSQILKVLTTQLPVYEPDDSRDEVLVGSK